MRASVFITAGLCLAALAASARGGEDIDRFFLPETPPAIEKAGIPAIDRPVLNKQNFVSDHVVTPSAIWSDPSFAPLAGKESAALIGVYQGTFDTLGCRVRSASPGGWQLDAESNHSSGEFPNLASENSRFTYRADAFLSPALRVSAELSAAENSLPAQRKDNYRIASQVTYYARPSLRLSGNFRWTKTDIKSVDNNEGAGAGLALFWQPLARHSLKLSFARENDTGFTAFRKYDPLDAVYSFFLKNSVVIGMGTSYQDTTWYPRASASWRILPGLRAAVYYEPGFERPSWSELYESAYLVRTAPGLLLPESAFLLRESVSYYWSGNSSAEVEFYQKNTKNSVVWSDEGRSGFVTPSNLAERYVAGVRAAVQHRIGSLTPRLAFSHNASGDAPFEPSFSVKASAEYAWRFVRFTGGYEHLSERSYAFNDPGRLEAYGTFSFGLTLLVNRNVELFAEGANLSGRRIELQPGLYRESPVVTTGLQLKF